jgi:hypothetical protein
MRRIDIRRSKRADLLAAKRRIVGHSQHHSVSWGFPPAHLENVLPLLFVRDPPKPAMALNQWSPTHSRAQWVSYGDPFFNQVVIEEPDHSEMLMQGRIRQRGSRLSLAFGGTLSDMLDVSTDYVTNNGRKLKASRRQKSQIRIEITSVGVKRIRCQASCGLKLQPVSRVRSFGDARIPFPSDFADREL